MVLYEEKAKQLDRRKYPRQTRLRVPPCRVSATYTINFLKWMGSLMQVRD